MIVDARGVLTHRAVAGFPVRIFTQSPSRVGCPVVAARQQVSQQPVPLPLIRMDEVVKAKMEKTVQTEALNKTC